VSRAKYRPNKVKVRHHVLTPLRGVLDRIAQYPEVDAITPGAISPKRGGSVGLTVQYRTPSGLRLIGRSGGAAQEVYVVTAAPDAVLARLAEDGLIARPPPPPTVGGGGGGTDRGGGDGPASR
jgi:hypothetical protein